MTTPQAVTARSVAGIEINQRFWIVLSLLIVYIIWGTTYLAIRFALESYPPYMLMGLRFLMAGGSLFIVLRLRGARMPTARQWRSAAIVGGLLLVGGMGSVANAEQAVSSGLAATLVATSPLIASLLAMLWGERPHRNEWIGVGIGLVGVGLLSLEGNLQANPGAVALIFFAMFCWSLGSVWSKHLDMPEGSMGNAAEMLVGGAGLMIMALLHGERITTLPTLNATLALLYLTTFGSLATMTAYHFLLKTVSPTLATSYAFVNPAIALLLGVILGGEHLSGSALIALPVILIGVAFVAMRRKS